MEKRLEKGIRELSKNQFPELESLFGKEGFNPEKSIRLEKDVDQDNNERELGNYEAMWTELKDPETGEVIEAKVYIPKVGKVDKVLIVSPGYRGDFVLQESNYADDFAKDGRIVIFMRHNGIRIGEEMKNYTHCPEKSNLALTKGQQHMGKGDDFNFESANREVLTALKVLGQSIDSINKIDVVGHSWGGRISLLSISELVSGIGKDRPNVEQLRKIASKIDNLILMGAWLETRAENIEPYLEYFESEAAEGIFKNMNPQECISSAVSQGKRLSELNSQNFPQQMRIVGLQSVGDEHVDLEGEYEEFFKRMRGLERKGSIILKDLMQLKGEVPAELGNRETEAHDYALRKTGEASRVRQWVGEIIK